MQSRSYPVIAREGWWVIALLSTTGFIILFTGEWVLAGVLALLAGFVAYILRDPKRKTPGRPLGIVSPVDGVIESIERDINFPKMNTPADRIRVRMHLRGSYSIHCPLEGRIVELWPHDIDHTGINNAFIVSTDERDYIALICSRRVPSFKPRLYFQPGERVGHGQRCGFNFLGKYVDLYVPSPCRAEISVGDKVSAGETIVAYLIRNEGVSGLVDTQYVSQM